MWLSFLLCISLSLTGLTSFSSTTGFSVGCFPWAPDSFELVYWGTWQRCWGSIFEGRNSPLVVGGTWTQIFAVSRGLNDWVYSLLFKYVIIFILSYCLAVKSCVSCLSKTILGNSHGLLCYLFVFVHLSHSLSWWLIFLTEMKMRNDTQF